MEGQENIQEILSKRLYLCQFLVALDLLRPGINILQWYTHVAAFFYLTGITVEMS